MARRLPTRGAAAALALVLLGGACTTESSDGAGGDGGDGSATAADIEVGQSTWDPDNVEVDMPELECEQTAEDPTRGVTDTEVRVGALATITGPTTSLWGDAVSGAKARLERANAEGGVHGRTITMVAEEDDGLESSRSIDAARRLAQNEQVFAVVPAISQVPSYADVLCEEVVPYFGWGFTPAYCNNSLGFGFNGCQVPTIGEYPSSAKVTFQPLLGDTDKTIVLVGNETESARRGIENIAGAMEEAGFDIVAEMPVLPADQPITDPTPYVQEIMTANDGEPPAAVWYIADFSNTSTMTQAVAGAGYQGLQFNSVGYDPRLKEADMFEGTYVYLQWLPFEESDHPFVAQMIEDLEEYAPDAPHSLPTAAGYLAADMFVEALEATGPDLTVDSFLETLNGGDFTYDPEGMFGGSHWPINHVIATPCGTIVKLEDHEYSLAVPLSCAD